MLLVCVACAPSDINRRLWNVHRAEMKEMEAIVRKHALELLPGVSMEVCGSYRRGAETSGDIDILFAYESGSAPCLRRTFRCRRRARLPSTESLMSCHAMPCTALIDRLKAIEFITDELVGVSSAKPAVVDRADTPGYDSTTDSPLPYGSPTYRIGDREPAARFASDSAGSTQPRPRLADPEACTTWMGVCRLGPGRLHRRIDLKAYPRSQYPFAVFYFTGAAVGVMSM